MAGPAKTAAPGSLACLAPTMESLEQRQLLSLTVATPIPDVVLPITSSTASIDMRPVFGDTQTAVRFQTSVGTFDALLFDAQTPLTVANFLQYATAGDYDETFFHRSIPGFVIQAGGYDSRTGQHIDTNPAVQNEPGISNTRGTIAMAKVGGNPNSATSEWFVNLANNSGNLDFQNGGFTVFGRVIGDGMDVVDLIASLNIDDYSGYDPALTDVPVDAQRRLVTMTVGEIPMLNPGGLSWMTLAVTGNSNPGLVTVSLSGSTLKLDHTPGQVGTSRVTIEATDMLGNTVENSFDVAAADVTVNDLISSTSTATLSGIVADDGTDLEVDVNGASYTWSHGDIAISGAAWHLALPALPDGDYPVLATVTRPSGQTTASGRLLIDTQAPTVAFTDGQLPGKANAATALTGTFDDANIAGIVVTLDNGHGGTLPVTAAVDAEAKTWSALVPIAGLADGAYGVSVKATDVAGHFATANGAGQLTVDTVADVTVNNRLSTSSTPTLTGTVGADVATLEIGVAGSTYTLADGDITLNGTAWSLALPATADGTHAVSVTATDDVGNTKTVEGQLVIDTILPVVALAAGQLPATVRSATSLHGTFDEAHLAAVVLTLDNGHGGTFDFTAIIDAQAGTWSAPVSIAGLADGAYDVRVRATDLVGNSTTQDGPGPLTLDTVADVTVNDLASKVSTPTLTGTVGLDVTTLRVTVNAATYTLADGDIVLSGTDWSLILPATGEGNYTVSVTATDVAGNTTTVAGQLLVDATAPVVRFTEGQLPAYVKGNTPLAGTFVDAGMSGVTVTLDDGHGGTFDFTATIDAQAGTWTAQVLVAGLADGAYAVSAAGTDLAGNSGSADGDGQWVLDRADPLIAFDDNGQLPAKVRAAKALTGTYADADISAIVVTLDDGQGGSFDFPAAIDAADETWSVLVPVAGLADGTYVCTATATDLAGNSASQDAGDLLTVDRVVDVAVNNVQSRTAAPTLSGTVAADVVAMEVTIGAATYTLAHGDITVSGTDWSLPLPATADGNYTASVRATDDAGNVKTVQGQILVDQTAPTVAVTDGQLPATTHADKALSGTFGDANISSVAVTLDDGHGGLFHFEANLNLGAKTWTALVPSAGLADGAYAVSVKATDVVGNATTIAGALLTVDTIAPVVSTGTVITTSGRPGLSGTIDDPTATILVKIGNATAAATNNGGGTWTLAAGSIAALPDGVYHVTVTAADAAGNQRVFTDALVVVDTTAPVVTVDRLTTTDTSPALSGRVNDSGAQVVVRVNGVDYNAVNDGDGTWSLAAGIIAALPQGAYNVTATATDSVGHVASDATTNELGIAATQSVTLGAGISKVTYVDTDGTTVTLAAGKGNASVSFTGVNVHVVQTSKTACAITTTGGVRQVDIRVVTDTVSLTFSTGAQGDGLTSIHQITGGGILGSLNASGANLVGGIDMTGAIKTVKLHNIQSDIAMAGTWSKSTGVSIAASIIKNSTIQAQGILSLKANTITGSTIETGALGTLTVSVLADSNIQATTVKALQASSSYQNTNVTATTITSATLYNVETDNDGVAFGLHATTIKALRLNQDRVVLTWKKNFTNSINDFFVTLA